MAILLTTFQSQVDNLIAADDDELSQIARRRCIKAAVERYSVDRPDKYASDVTGDAGKYYALDTTLFAQWVEGFSRVLSIEYPAATIASDEQPVYLEPEDWDDDYWYNGGRYLWLPNHAPAATEKMRVTYSVPYAWAASSTITSVVQGGHGFSVNDYVYLDETWQKATDEAIATHQVSTVTDTSNFAAKTLQAAVPTGDFFAVCHLAAGLCCHALAAKYAKSSDSTISADSTAHTTRSGEFARRAAEFIALYERHLGLNAENEKVRPASAFVDWDTEPSWPPGRQFLFHGRGTR